MSKFATGKYAKAISDRSGLAFPYQEMVREWNGSFVHKSEYEAKAPQVQPTPHKGDAQALRNVRTDRDETAVPQLLGINPFTTGSASSSTITVTERNHGRSTGDTVRFRTVSGNLFGASKSEIEAEAGFSITKTDDDFYTFIVSTAPSITGSGGGGQTSSGPATLSN